MVLLGLENCESLNLGPKEDLQLAQRIADSGVPEIAMIMRDAPWIALVEKIQAG
jgi:hypothetical protein